MLQPSLPPGGAGAAGGVSTLVIYEDRTAGKINGLAQRGPSLSKRECFDAPVVALGLRNCRPGPDVPSFAFPEIWILDQRRPACGCPLWAFPVVDELVPRWASRRRQPPPP